MTIRPLRAYGDFDLFDAFDASDNLPMPRTNAARFLTDLVEVIEAAGLMAIEVGGWQTRARGSGGYTDDRPWCIVWHHTASNTDPENDVDYIIGAEDAPLANLYLDRDGDVWVCAAGATNTNGKGGPVEMSRGTVPVDQMNTHAIGIEMANDGVGQVWPQVQIDAAFTLSIALCRAYGLTDDDICTHAEWAPGRKIDPARADAVDGPWQPGSINTSGTWSVSDLRAEQTRRAGTEPPPDPEPTPTPPGDDEMKQIYYVVTGANAKFIGIPPIVEWTGPGTEEAAAAIAKQIELGNLVQEDLTGGPNAFSLSFLRGPLPEGDTLHEWTGAEFAGLLG